MNFIVKVNPQPARDGAVVFSVLLKRDDVTVIEIAGWRLRDYSQLLPPRDWGRDGRQYANVLLPDLAFQHEIIDAVLSVVDPYQDKRQKVTKREVQL